MKKYKTLIIGSSFSSIGFAHASEDVLIIEQTEMADTSFYMSQRGFEKCDYTPLTDAGRELDSIFRERGVINDRGQNVSAFEICLCRFAEKHGINIYLKCRVVESRSDASGTTVTLLHNGGLEDVYAERIIDTRRLSGGKRYLAVIFDAPEREIDRTLIESAFPSSPVRDAFYEGRYVLYADVDAEDINDAKVEICRRWQKLDGYRILYVAHAFYYSDAEHPRLSDGHYKNPIEAFEGGILLAEEEF